MREIIGPTSILIATSLAYVVELLIGDFNIQRFSTLGLSMYFVVVALLNSPLSKFKVPLKKSWKMVLCKIGSRIVVTFILAMFALLASPNKILEIIFSTFLIFESSRIIIILNSKKNGHFRL